MTRKLITVIFTLQLIYTPAVYSALEPSTTPTGTGTTPTGTTPTSTTPTSTTTQLPISSAIPPPSSTTTSGSGSTTSGTSSPTTTTDTSGTFRAPIPTTRTTTIGGQDIETSASGTPFILRSGYFDAGELKGESVSTSSTAVSVYVPTATNSTCVSRSADKSASCRYEIDTGESKQCPSGFLPFAQINISSLASTTNAPVFACVAPGLLATPETAVTGGTAVERYDKSRGVRYDTTTNTYKFTVITSALEGQSKDDPIPFVSFQWTLQCYPKHIAPPLPAKTCDKNIGMWAPPILWDAGIIHETSATERQGTFETHRRCPRSYDPYIILGQGATAGKPDEGSIAPGQHSNIGPGGACIIGITNLSANTASTYSVEYLSHQTYSEVQFSDTSLTVKDPTDGTIRSLPWSLYCYPPGAPGSPSYGDKCRSTHRPF